MFISSEGRGDGLFHYKDIDRREEPVVTICKGKYGKLKAIKSSSIRLEGYLKNGMCSRCRTKRYAI
jgi:hypothetical protein